MLEDRALLATVAWDGGGDGFSWHDPLNWDGNSLPAAEDDAVIDVPTADIVVELNTNTGDVSVNSVESKERLQIVQGASLSVSAASTLSDGVTLSTSGRLAGAGDITLLGSSSIGTNAVIEGTGRLTVAAGASFSIGSIQSTHLSRITDVFGTLTVGTAPSGTATARLQLEGIGDQLIIQPGGILNLNNTAAISSSSGARIVNQGMVQQSGDGLVVLAVEFVNQADVQLLEGTLHINAGGSSSTAIDVSAGAVLNLGSDFDFISAVALTGGGRLEVKGGIHDFTGSDILLTGSATFTGGTVTIANTLPAELQIDQIRTNVTFNADQTLNSVDADFGRIDGTGNLTFTGASRFNQSTVGGTGTLIVAEDATVNIFSLGATFNRPVENFGLVRATGTGRFNEGIFNHAGATFDADPDFLRSLVATPFINHGTFTKSGEGIASFLNGSSLVNHGQITIAAGELVLRDGSTTTSIDVPADTTLRFSATFEFAPGIALTGDGNVIFQGSADYDFTDAQFLLTGTVEFSRFQAGVPTVTIANTLPTELDLAPVWAVLVLNADQTFESVRFEPTSRIQGSGDVTVTGETIFNGLSWEGTGAATIASGAQARVFGNNATFRRRIDNFGTLNVLGNQVSIGESFFNHPGSEFLLGSGARLGRTTDLMGNLGSPAVVNEGLFSKTGVERTNVFEVIELENRGTVRVEEGELFVVTPLPPSEGRFEILSDGVLTLGGALELLAGGVLTGSGIVDGNVRSFGTLRPGDGIGTLVIDGNYTQTTEGVLEIQIGGRAPGTEYDQLNVTGSAVMEGTLTVELANGFSPAVGDAFSLISFASTDGQFGTTSFPDISPLEFVVNEDAVSLSLTVQQQSGAQITPTFRGAAAAGSVVTITANEVELGTAVAGADGRWSFTVSSPLTEDSYALSVTGDGPARFDLTAPLDIGDGPVGDFGGLVLSDDAITFFPFGDDLDGMLDIDDVIVSADAARLGLDVDVIAASTFVGLAQRTYGGRLLLDQQTPSDPVPDYELAIETLVSSVPLAAVLPFGLRRIGIRNIDLSSGFSAEFFAMGTFGEIDLARPVPTPEKAARARIRQLLEEATTEPEPELIAFELNKWMTEGDNGNVATGTDESAEAFFLEILDEGVNAQLRAFGNNPPEIRTVGDIKAAEGAILHAFRLEGEVDHHGVRSFFEGDDAFGLAFTEMYRLRENAAELILLDSVTHANSKSLTTEEDFKFVLAILSFASTAELLALPVSASQTIRDLAPAIEKEITRLQFEAVSLEEIREGIDNSTTLATANEGDILEAGVGTTKGFIDTFIARIAADDLNPLQLANTAVQLASDLVPEAVSPSDPMYSPDAVTGRIRAHIADFEFDPENLLPERRPEEPLPEPAEDPRAFVLMGNLPEDLTTDGVTDLIANVPEGVTRFVPLQSEFEFSFRVDVTTGDVVPVNLPLLTVGFDNLHLGKSFEAAGFISLGSYGESGQFEKVTFAGGLDVTADLAGFKPSLGFTINGTGDDRGFFPDASGRGGQIVAEAIVDFDFTTPPGLPAFHLDIQAQAAFDVRMHIDSGLSFTFEEFGLTDIVVEQFAAAIGGTPPPDGADSPIPDDALLVLSAEPVGETPAVTIHLDDTSPHLVTFGKLSVQTGGIIGEVANFAIDAHDSGITLAPLDDFAIVFRTEQLAGQFASRGVPEILTITDLQFAPGPGFTTQENLLDFELIVSGELNLPIPNAPVHLDVEGLVIDIGAWASGDEFPLRFNEDGDAGVSLSIEMDFGAFTLEVGGGFRSLVYTPLDANGVEIAGETRQTFYLYFTGFLAIGDVAGIGAELVWSEFGPVAFSLEGSGEIPIAQTGAAFKRLRGRVILNAPELPQITTPLDLFAASEDGETVNFTSLAGSLPLAEMEERTRTLARENSQILAKNDPENFPVRTTWSEDYLIAIDADIGPLGDPTGSIVVSTALGARFSPKLPAEPDFDLKIFGLGTATLMEGSDQEVPLGTIGALLDLADIANPVFTIALETSALDNPFDVPAELAIGLTFAKDGDQFQLLLEGTAAVEGLADAATGGVLIVEPDLGFYGALQVTIDVGSRGDDLFLGGELFVRFNSTGAGQDLDPEVATDLLPQLVEPAIPPGFGLFGQVEVEFLQVLEGSGTLEIVEIPDGLSAHIELEGSLFDGVVSAGIEGTLELGVSATLPPLRLQRLDVDAFIEAILIPDFLEARGDGRLRITDSGLEELAISADGVFLGIPFGPVGAEIDRHACLTLQFNEGTVETPLPGGECGVPDEPEPMRMTVGNVATDEGDFGQRTFNVPITFENAKSFLVPADLEDPGIELEFWTVSRPDDTAVGLSESGDYRRIERGRAPVPAEFESDFINGLQFYRLPSRFDLPVTVFGDTSIEADETFSVFVQPVVPGFHPQIGRSDDGFGRITILNDDEEAQPPADSVVFFDLDILTFLSGPDGSLIPQWQFENGPDLSRPEFTFDVDRVSGISHSVETVQSPNRSGLPRIEDISRAVVAETWLTRVATDSVDPDPIAEIREGIGGGQQTLDDGGDIVEQREFFEFTIEPTLSLGPFGTQQGVRVDGIDFWDRTEIGGTQWEVRYSLDDFQTVLASAATHGGTFGHNRVEFDYPAGQSGNLPSDTPITFRIYGPRPLTVLDTDPLPWHVDNLALFGGSYTALEPAVKSGPVSTDILEQATTLIDNRTVTTTDTSGETTTTKVVKDTQIVDKRLLTSLVFNGLSSDAVVFLDANANGVPDFLDLNGDGIQDPGEPLEPIVATDAGGLFEFSVPREFDLNTNGILDVSEGLLVASGGVDLGTGLDLQLRFKAPTGALAITPLTTAISSLLTRHGGDVDQAHDLFRDGLVVGGEPLPESADLYAHDPVTQINEGGDSSIPEYQAITQVHDTAVLFAHALAAAGGDLSLAGDHVFDAMADELLHEGTLSLTDSAALGRILATATGAGGLSLPSDVAQAVINVAVNANLAIESVDEPAGLGYLAAVKKLQRVVQSETAAEVQQFVAGTLSREDLLAGNTVSSLQAQGRLASAGDIFPVAINIDNVAAAEPAEGAVDFEFTVSLSAPSTLPVTVDYETRGSTATSEEGDFLATAGTITFAPGETEQTILVSVLADDVEEVGETYHVQLSNPHNALLAALRGVGTIRMPPAAAILPGEIQLGDRLVVFVDEPLEIRAALPGIVSGTVDWGDGTVEPVTLSDDVDRVVVRAAHQYAVLGNYEVVVTMTHTSGQEVIGRRSVVVIADLPGDFNGSGLVEQADLDLVLGDWGRDGSTPPAAWINDLPVGIIDQEELDAVLANWGATFSRAAAAARIPLNEAVVDHVCAATTMDEELSSMEPRTNGRGLIPHRRAAVDTRARFGTGGHSSYALPADGPGKRIAQTSDLRRPSVPGIGEQLDARVPTRLLLLSGTPRSDPQRTAAHALDLFFADLGDMVAGVEEQHGFVGITARS